jgi:hypothetical protein
MNQKKKELENPCIQPVSTIFLVNPNEYAAALGGKINLTTTFD